MDRTKLIWVSLVLLIVMSFIEKKGDGQNTFLKPGYKVTQVNFLPLDTITILKSQDHIDFPSIVKLKNNKLLIGYREGMSHVDNLGRLMKLFGSPDGKYWSKPHLLYDDPGVDDRDVSMVVSNKGTININFFKYIEGDCRTSPRAYSNFYSTSFDNGLSFTTPKRIDRKNLFPDLNTKVINGSWVDEHNNLLYYFGSSSQIVIHKNKFILPAYGGESMVYNISKGKFISKKWRIVLFESLDKGLTWNERYINPVIDSSLYWSEPSLAVLDDNTMILHYRTSEDSNSPGGIGRMKQLISRDGGETWLEATTFNFVGHAPDLTQLSNGVLISTFRMKDKNKEKTSFMYSLDKGTTWCDVITIYQSKGESGYPSIVELSPGKIMIIYYADNARGIEGQIFEMKSKYEKVI